MKTILNLGCGTDIMKGSGETQYINIDICRLEDVDIVMDLNIIEYPFAPESVDIIIMNDILEHLENPIDVLQECWRILREGGECRIKVVYWNNQNSFSDPQHKHFFTEKYFYFFTGVRRAYYMKHHFSSVEIKYSFTDKAINKYGSDRNILLEKAYFHCNIIRDMEVVLTK